MAAAFDWIKVYNDLPDHPKVHALADALELAPVTAIGHVISLWLWCSRYAPDGLIQGRTSVRAIERAAKWNGEGGAFVDAAIEARLLEAVADGSLLVYAFEEHNAAHRERAEKDKERHRQRYAELRPPAKVVSADSPQRLRRDSPEPPRSLWGEKEKEKEKENDPHSPPEGGGGGVTSPSASVEGRQATATGQESPETAPPRENAPRSVSEDGRASRTRQRRSAGPSLPEVVEPTGDLAKVWGSYATHLEPAAVLTGDRAQVLGAMVQAFGVERVLRAIEGHAGSAFLRTRPHLRSFDRLVGSVAAIEAGLRQREAPDWRPSLAVVRRERPAAPPRPAMPEAPVRDPAEVLAELRAAGAMPSFRRAEGGGSDVP